MNMNSVERVEEYCLVAMEKYEPEDAQGQGLAQGQGQGRGLGQGLGQGQGLGSSDASTADTEHNNNNNNNNNNPSHSIIPNTSDILPGTTTNPRTLHPPPPSRPYPPSVLSPLALSLTRPTTRGLRLSLPPDWPAR